jgi:UDP-N-acetylglucosamine--N-acetylmuramyl-(pentapeptide) pyrophosphoryl-undecaprenol N-acetylglucosamine transferase
LTTRWLAGLVTVSGTISEEASRRFAASRPGIMRLLTPRLRCEVLGTPVRPEVLSTSREEGLRALGLRADKLTILITGGSIGAPAINAAWAEAMPALAADEGFASRVQVLHLTGRGKSAATPVAGLDYHPRPYLDEMHWAYAAADIVVSRGGGSALAEITARGIPAIVVPWAGAAGNHQFYNAQPLQERGAAILISDAELSAETLTEALRELVRDDAKRAAMAQASKALGIPDAADRVVAVVRRLARR